MGYTGAMAVHAPLGNPSFAMTGSTVVCRIDHRGGVVGCVDIIHVCGVDMTDGAVVDDCLRLVPLDVSGGDVAAGSAAAGAGEVATCRSLRVCQVGCPADRAVIMRCTGSVVTVTANAESDRRGIGSDTGKGRTMRVMRCGCSGSCDTGGMTITAGHAATDDRAVGPSGSSIHDQSRATVTVDSTSSVARRRVKSGVHLQKSIDVLRTSGISRLVPAMTLCTLTMICA